MHSSAKSLPAIDQLLPHGTGMIFLDELTAVHEAGGAARLNAARLAPFADSAGRLPSHLGLECMVQTVSALAGWRRRQRGEAPLVGLVLGARNCRFNVPFLPYAGQLTVQVEMIMMEEPLGVFAAQLRSEDMVLVQGHIKAIQPQTQAQLKNLIEEAS